MKEYKIEVNGRYPEIELKAIELGYDPSLTSDYKKETPFVGLHSDGSIYGYAHTESYLIDCETISVDDFLRVDWTPQVGEVVRITSNVGYTVNGEPAFGMKAEITKVDGSYIRVMHDGHGYSLGYWKHQVTPLYESKVKEAEKEPIIKEDRVYIKRGTVVECVRRKGFKGDASNYSKEELEVGVKYVVRSVRTYVDHEQDGSIVKRLGVTVEGCNFVHPIQNFII